MKSLRPWHRRLVGTGLLLAGLAVLASYAYTLQGGPFDSWSGALLWRGAIVLVICGPSFWLMLNPDKPGWWRRVGVVAILMLFVSFMAGRSLPGFDGLDSEKGGALSFAVIANAFGALVVPVLIGGYLLLFKHRRGAIQVCGGLVLAGAATAALLHGQAMAAVTPSIEAGLVEVVPIEAGLKPVFMASVGVGALLGAYLLAGFPAIRPGPRERGA